MLQRAERIVRSSQSASSTQQQTARGAVSRFTEAELVRKWFIITMKMIFFIRHMLERGRMVTVLGSKRVYMTLFQEYQQAIVSDQLDSTHGVHAISRIINGEGVGRELTKGTGQAFPHESVCEHPQSNMVRHANRHMKWWTCTGCQKRWLRTTEAPVQNLRARSSGTPKHDDVVNFGRFEGLTYEQVWRTQPAYCQWMATEAATRRADPNPSVDLPSKPFLRLLSYLEMMDANENARREALQNTALEDYHLAQELQIQETPAFPDNDVVYLSDSEML